MFDKNKWMSEYRKTDRYKQYQKQYKQKNRERLNKQDNTSMKKRKLKDPQRFREAYRSERLLRKYGLTLDQYREMYEKQQGLCAICDTPESALSYQTAAPFRLAIDHDHKTGRVRGLLCFSCNRALGYFKDSSTLLKKALQYLE